MIKKTNTMGTELFSRRGVERYTKENVTVVNDDGTTKVNYLFTVIRKRIRPMCIRCIRRASLC